MFRTIITLGLAASLAYAASERETAEWVLRWEGRVTLDGSRQAVSDLSQLPEGEFHITGIDLTVDCGLTANWYILETLESAG